MHAIFLDFDGVIVDSVKECFLTSEKAYFGPLAKEKDLSENEKLFYRERGVVKPAWQFMVLQIAIEKHLQDPTINIPQEFDAIITNLTDEQIKKFEQTFFSARRERQHNHEKWLSEHSLTEFGKFLQNKHLDNYFILTTKDRHSVELLLNFYHISIPNIFDKNDYNKWKSKGATLTHFFDTHPEYHSGTFVDDVAGHLDSVTDRRITNYFADWGYGKNSNYPIYHKKHWEEKDEYWTCHR